MLSGIGGVIYATIVTVLSVLTTLCLETDGERALLCLFVCILFFAAAYFTLALLIHDKLPLVIASYIVSIAGSFILTSDPARSVMCTGAYVTAIAVWLFTRKKLLSYTGNICLAASFGAWFFVVMLCTLAYRKYGSFGLDSLVRAYESFCEVILREPRATVLLLEAEATEEMAGFISNYKSLVATLEELLSLMIYSVPSLFLSICSVGGFAVVFGAKRHRAMAGLEDTVGRFEISVVSAVLFVVANLLTLFIDPITPIGIALITVRAPLELGLAFSGLIYGISWIRKNNKNQMYYVIVVIIAVMMPSVCVALLAYLGAYRIVFLDRLRRLAEKKGQRGQGLTEEVLYG